MKTITIRGIDQELAKRIKDEANKRKTSINQLALKILRSALGLGDKQVFRTHNDLDLLAGTWTEKDTKLFLNTIKELNEIDMELWK